MHASAPAPDEEIDVLIIGGSLVGLSTAMFLGIHGIRALAVERHASTAIHPRAGHFQLRTSEVLRSAGLEDRVRRRSEEQYLPNGGINNVESLAGREIASYFPNLNAGVEEFSPTIRMFIDQDTLEPILRERALELGAQLRYRTQCTALAQDADGVTATLSDLERDNDLTIRAQYVVAADGNRSPTRDQLGIAMRGHGLLSNSVTIYFRADVDLGPLLAGRDQGVNYVTNPVLRGFFRLDRTGNQGFLVVNLVGDTARPEIIAAYPSAPWANVAESIDEARALELLRAAIGVPEIPVTVEDIATWRAVADSAERYCEGRVFLAGDAAHTMPPNGGFGGNTGVQDAHNLAWKLAYVLKGIAGPGLLDTYDSERRPIGELTVEQAYARYVTRVAPYLGTEGMQEIVDDWSMEIGYRYNSAAVALETDARPPEAPLHEHPRESKGRPGSRAPHVAIERAGTPLSTLDLFGTAYVLLAGPDGEAWHDAASRAAETLDVPLDAYRVGSAELPDPAGGFAAAYGISASGAALVRPDGCVAWRAHDAAGASDTAVKHVLEALLLRHRDAPSQATVSSTRSH
ncbi:MAG TPA: FAD-dependent monooxygenase [Solirubrobacteraceae bacterium]|nr:FAD-dependent monooxygenase [Solirubrobacteraceae bacterium]